MKKKFSEILGVSLTLALLTSLLLVAAPVRALSQPAVTLATTADAVISRTNADYSISFVLGKELTVGDTITITFPSDTVISAPTATIAASPGWVGGAWTNATVAGATFAHNATLRTVTATLSAGDAIGEAATVLISITAGITNPCVPGDYTLTVHTSQELTPVESTAYVITIPLRAPWPVVSLPTGQNIISLADADYVISIGLGEELGAGDTITVTFPSDTVVSAPTANITASIGWIGGIYKDATLNAVTWTADTANRTVTATLGTGDEVGELAHVWIEIAAGITNPSVPGDYTLTVHTSQETTPVESNAYTIKTPPDPSLPGIVEVYNPAG